MRKERNIFFTLLITLSLIVTLFPIGTINAATSYSLNATTKTITGVGKTFQLVVTAPQKSKITYTSMNKTIATVSKNGLITAKKKGNTSISCAVKTGKITKYLVCKITVKVPAKAIVITNAKIDEEKNAHIIELGSTYDFAAKRISSSTKSESSDVIRFYVKDTKVATVNNKTGLVTPIKEGFTTLVACAGATANKATSAKNTVKQEINIYVTKPEVKVTDCTLKHSQALEITFNRAMNASTILESDGKLLPCVSIVGKKGASELGTLSGSLSEDRTILTVKCSKMFSGSYDISLGKTILSQTGYALKAYSETFDLKDTTKPTYIGCTVDETGLIVSMNFSEPISITDLSPAKATKINGGYLVNTNYFLDKQNYKLSDDHCSILLDLSSLSTSDQNCTIELKLYGIVDYANNITNPYPLVAQIYTNTTTTTQASLVTLYRNGNSLVAQFDKKIKTPGYAMVDGNYIQGMVNPKNKKEVIYNLSSYSFNTISNSVSVTLNGYSTYNASSGSSSITKTITFATNANLPQVTSNSFTTVIENGISKNVLTLTFSQDVSLVQTSGQITATSNVDGVIGASTPYHYDAAVKDNTVTLTFTDSFAESGIYTFTLPEKLVVDAYYNFNANAQIIATKQAGETSPLPGPSCIQMSSDNNYSIYITFDTMVDTQTAQDKNNYSISGLVIDSATLVSNTYNSPAIVKLTTRKDSIEQGAPYQIEISNIKGYKGAYKAMDTYKAMVYLTKNKTLNYNSVEASSKNKTVVISFSYNLSASSRVHYVAQVDNKNVEIKSSQVKDNQITITLTDTIATGKTIVLKPTIDNFIVDMNNNKLLNESITGIVR